MTAMAQVTPTLEEFIELAKQGNVIPVFAEFIADGETPVSAFKKLDRGGYSFLFESTEKNDVSGRFSFVGVDARVVLQSYDREVRIIEGGRYHSLVVERDSLPASREVVATATDDPREIHALRHATHPVWGVQFHPESVLTHDGKKILARFLTLV